ncbi:MAG: hypothetical protein V4620_03440 [Bacteroidota bacterium]
MDNKVKIKLGNINNLSDARFAAAAGIDYMGFCFDSTNVNYIPPVRAQQIIEWTTGCFIVAEFGPQSLREITDIVDMLNIDIVELNNDLLPTDISGIDKPIIKKIDIDAWSTEAIEKQLSAYADKVDAFHLYNSQHTTNLDEAWLKNLCATYKIIWGLNTSSENIPHIVNTYHPYALNITGGDEEKTGMKDFEELNLVLDALGLYES